MTDQRDKLIEEICGSNNDEIVKISDVKQTLLQHLSDKLILDRKQVEEMIEKRNEWKIAFELDRKFKEFIQDLQSLLNNQANDSE